ncbi:hypothetical protein TB1_026249 [Malus domestica]
MSTHGLTHVIWKECGPDAACKFLGNASYLCTIGFCIMPIRLELEIQLLIRQQRKKIKQTISQAKDEVGGLISKARFKQLEAKPGRTLVDSFENKVNQVR